MPGSPASGTDILNKLILWIARGFGAGLSPIAPGTVGSCLGLIWFLGLLALGHPGILLAAIGLSVIFSIWCCGAAEKLLNQTDPASVVLDEIVATPLCFAGWLIQVYRHEHALPAPGRFLDPDTWPIVLLTFVLFRAFDTLKPWPLRQCQTLPGGWGITADDLVATGYVNLCILAFLAGNA
jgi:phosphatidylglycerophosphatase A